MAEIEKLLVKVSADLTDLKAELDKATLLAQNAGKGMATGANKGAVAFLTAERSVNGLKAALGSLAVAGLAQATRQALGTTAGIKDLAIQTGLSTEAVQELRYAFSQLGIEQATGEGALRKFTVELGRARAEGGEAAKSFRQIGLDPDRFANAEQALNQTIDALRAIEDPTIRAARAFDLFGREAGVKMVQLIEKGSAGLDRLRAAAREAGAVLSDDVVPGAAAANDKLAALDQVLTAQVTAALVALAPALTTIVGLMASLAKATRETGEGLGILFGKLMAGSIEPFEDKIDDARESVERLKAAIAKGTPDALNMVGVTSIEGATKALKDQEAELQRLIKAREDLSRMVHAPEAPPAIPKAPPISDEVLKKQRDLMRAISAETAQSGQALARQTIESFGRIGDGLNTSYQQALAYTTNFYATEASLERQRHEQQLEDFQKQADDLRLSKEQRDRLLEQMESTHQGNMVLIEREGQEAARQLRERQLDDTLYRYEAAIGMQQDLARQLQNFEKLTGEQRYDTAVGLAEGLLGSLGKTSRKSFELSKKVALAEAVVNTYRAAAMALGSSANIYVGLAKAAVALAFGFAQVRAIQATQYGGSGPGGGVGGARTVGGQIDEQNGGRGSGPSVRTLEVRGINPNDLFTGRQIIDIINAAIADGGTIKVT